MSQLQQIASVAGVSVRTVARILNDDSGAERRPKAASRAAHVRQIALGLGYRPSSAAKAVKTGRFDAVTLLTSSDQPAYVSNDFLFGAEQALADRGMHLILARMPERSIAETGELPRVIRETTSDGLLVHAIDELSPAAAAALLRYRIPTVWVNARRATDAVYIDDEQASFDLATALMRGGAVRVGFATRPRAPSLHYSYTDRLAGYHRAAAAAGQPAVVVEVPRASYHMSPSAPPIVDVLAPAVRELTDGDARGGALIGDTRTVGAALLAAERMGVRVPERFTGGAFASHAWNESGVRYPMAILPEADLGRRAVELLLRKIDDPGTPLPPVSLRATIANVTET